MEQQSKTQCLEQTIIKSHEGGKKKKKMRNTGLQKKHNTEMKGVTQPAYLGIPVERIRGIIIRSAEEERGLPFIMPNTRKTSALSDAAGSSNPAHVAKKHHLRVSFWMKETPNFKTQKRVKSLI